MRSAAVRISAVIVLGILALVFLVSASVDAAPKGTKASQTDGKGSKAAADSPNSSSYIVGEDDFDESDSDGLIQDNSDYEGGYEGGNGESSSDDDEYDEEEDDVTVDNSRAHSDADKEPKAAVNSALASQKKNKKNSNLPRKVLTFVKKYRIQITIVLAMVAFRQEIRRYIYNKLAPEIIDPETGKVIGRQKLQLLPFLMNPTSILKILVFIDIMRQLQTAKKTKRDPLLLALILLGAKNPVMSSILTKTLLQENNSYVPRTEQHYTFEKLNDRYEKDGWALQKAANANSKTKTKPPHDHLSAMSMLSQLRDAASKTDAKKYTETIIVLDLQDINKVQGRIDVLRDEVSFLIHQHRQKLISYSDTVVNQDDNDTELEILVLLESPGGSAADFALAAEQVLRLRKEAGIKVTICVDRVAASGGFMIACTSSPGKLYAAPFAVLGSIGVYGQAINVQKLLDGWGIQGMVFKAGKEKAPGGLIGDVSKRDKKSIQSMVDDTHAAFKKHVAEARPRLAKSIETIATGKIWLGHDALKAGLVDRIVTSDEYIRERMDDGARILKLIKNTRRRSLFGGGSSQNTPGVLDRRLLSLKAEAKKALHNLAERINIPLEDLDDAGSLSSRISHSSNVVAKGDGSLYSTSAPHL